MEQTIVNALFSGLGALLMMLISVIWNGLRELQKSDVDLAAQVAGIRVLVAGDYVKKIDFEKIYTKIDDKLDNIIEKLDKKVDR